MTILVFIIHGTQISHTATIISINFKNKHFSGHTLYRTTQKVKDQSLFLRNVLNNILTQKK